MPIYIQDEFKQLNDAKFPLLDDNNVRGGHRSVDTLAEMNSIPSSYRKEGMTVYVAETQRKYTLNASNQWTVEDVNSFIYRQIATSDIWIINHQLGYKPNITVIDSGGSKVYGDELHTNDNSVTLTFTSQFSGIAYLT